MVYSEPPPFNDVLMPPYEDWSGAELAGALRWTAHHLSGAAGEKPYVLKLRSWNSLRADLIRRAFPDTPWLFLVRDPLEVAVSVWRKPPTWLRAYGCRSNPFLPFLDERAADASMETYTSLALRAFADAVGAQDRRLGLLLRYDDFVEATWLKVTRHFGLELRHDAQARIAEQLRLYAKDFSRSQLFTPDGAGKRTDASAALRQAIGAFAAPTFERLHRTWSEA